MAMTAVRTPSEYEAMLQQYYFERSEESRAVRVGEKEVSEQAAIVARYADLFSRAQIDVLREAEEASAGDEQERLYRLRKTCEAGLISTSVAEQEDALENAILGARVTFQGEELPLRSALARLAVLDSYADREELGELERTASARFNAERLALITAWEEFDADLSGEPDPIVRNEEEKAISLRALEQVLVAASDATTTAWEPMRERWFDRLLGPQRDAVADERAHAVSPPALAARVDVHEGAFRRGLPRQRAGARLRHERDPEHSPRPRGPAAEEPACVRDRLGPAGGRAPDHASAGRARRLPGVHARGRPRAPLRRRRPAAAVHVPPDRARPRADGDLLVHLRGGDARAGLACAPFRALGRAGGGERAGDGVPRGAALPPLHGEAPLRARLLGELRGGGRQLVRATTRRCSPRRRASATTRAAISPTWTRASTRPTTSGPGSARRSSAPI